jgi:hypothetical protein
MNDIKVTPLNKPLSTHNLKCFQYTCILDCSSCSISNSSWKNKCKGLKVCSSYKMTSFWWGAVLLIADSESQKSDILSRCIHHKMPWRCHPSQIAYSSCEKMPLQSDMSVHGRYLITLVGWRKKDEKIGKG